VAQPDASSVGACRIAGDKYSDPASMLCKSYRMPSLWLKEKGQINFWNRSKFQFLDHRWNMIKKSLSAFSITKECNQIKFAPDLRRNLRMIFTVSVAFNVSARTFGRGEKIKNDQVGASLDLSTRKLSLALIVSHFIQYIRLLMLLAFYTR
jgi:hypothetical protein